MSESSVLAGACVRELLNRLTINDAGVRSKTSLKTVT